MNIAATVPEELSQGKTASSNLTSDIIFHILPFLSPADLAKTSRLSSEFHSLAIPLLYRHLNVDLSLPNPLLHPATLPLFYAPPPTCINPHLHHTQTLQISSQHHSSISALSSAPASVVALPNLLALHIHLDKNTYDWPQSCNMVRSLSEPGPPKLIISAEPGCDVVRWMIASRSFEALPSGVAVLTLISDTVQTDSRSDINLDRRTKELLIHGRDKLQSRKINLKFVTSQEVLSIAEGKVETPHEAMLKFQLRDIAILALLISPTTTGKLVVMGFRAPGRMGGEHREGWDLPRTAVEAEMKDLAEDMGLEVTQVEQCIAHVEFL